MGRSGPFLLALGYVFNRRTNAKFQMKRWYCTRYHQGCKAAVVTNEALVVTATCGEHTHNAPKLIYSCGMYHLIQ